MTITWGGNEHPSPSSVQESDDMIGTSNILASGALVNNALSTKMRIKLQWSGVTTAEANALFSQATTRTEATLDLTPATGDHYFRVIPIPNTARKSAYGGNAAAMGYDVSVDVRTVYDAPFIVELATSDDDVLGTDSSDTCRIGW